jgi:hypothetical protein
MPLNLRKGCSDFGKELEVPEEKINQEFEFFTSASDSDTS